ncbi:apolipoprotein N-acyltransferase [Alphaproteobacteria bacterium]|nr:apolipoprotein N-acyltransferase [Alphaproteobacteria bacterium]
MKKLYESTVILYTFNFFVGAIATLAIAPFSFFPIIFVLGLGIYSISEIHSYKKTFIASWFLGFGWFSFGLYWIGSAFFAADTYHMYLMPLSVIILPSILATFWALAFFLAKILTLKTKSPILLIIINLSLIEYLRANIFTGFPWLMPSMSFASNEYILQNLSYVGSFAGNLVILTLSVLPIILLSHLHNRKLIFSLLFIPIFILFSFSFNRFNNKEFLNQNKNQTIVLVQPNIMQKDKWNIKKRKDHIEKLIKLSVEKENIYKDKYKIIIWPETSFEGSIPKELKLLSNISKKIIKNENTTLVIGLLSVENKKLFNSLIFLNSVGKVDYKYNKIHLVPFGEYIPFRDNFKKIADYLSPSDFTRGHLKDNINLRGFGEIITLICYEILFSKEVSKRVSDNTKLLINITNDAWFGKTIGPHQHLALAKIRAVELGLPVVRVANTGISAFISPYGDEIVKIPINEESVRHTNLIPPLGETLYKKYGEYIFIISILYFLFIHYCTPFIFRKKN